jgi:hypothetical protein
MDNDQDQLLATSSPAASSASDSDAFNSTFARVHFGPLRSPEKKFVPIAARRDTVHLGDLNSQIGRELVSVVGSFSRGTPERVDVEDEGDQSDDEDDRDANGSRSGTPENDHFLQDGE